MRTMDPNVKMVILHLRNSQNVDAKTIKMRTQTILNPNVRKVIHFRNCQNVDAKTREMWTLIRMDCDKKIWHPHTLSGVVLEGGVAHQPVADYSGKQESDKDSRKQNGGKRGHLSPTLSISTSWYEHGRASLSISHVCFSGEANLRPWLVLRKKQPRKANTWWIFKQRRLVSCDLFITVWRHIMNRHLVVKGWRHIMSCHWFVEEWRHVIWDMKETQILK